MWPYLETVHICIQTVLQRGLHPGIRMVGRAGIARGLVLTGWLDITRYYQILPGITRYYQVLPDITRYYQTEPNLRSADIYVRTLSVL